MKSTVLTIKTSTDGFHNGIVRSQFRMFSPGLSVVTPPHYNLSLIVSQGCKMWNLEDDRTAQSIKTRTLSKHAVDIKYAQHAFHNYIIITFTKLCMENQYVQVLNNLALVSQTNNPLIIIMFQLQHFLIITVLANQTTQNHFH